jgi:uncharacterized membrane protein YkvA (DUF1232 family)
MIRRVDATAAASRRSALTWLQRLAARARAVPRLLRAWLSGRYRVVPWRSLVFGLLGALYVALPLDLIPDVILGLGLLDDAAVLAWWLRAVVLDLDAFVAWERARATADD